MSQPSYHPQFILVAMFEEALCDLLITGPVDGVLFDVRLELERLHP